MSRRIINDNLNGEVNQIRDKYFDRLMKYIPTEAIAFWIATNEIVKRASDSTPKTSLLWILFAVGLILTFGWIFKHTEESGKQPAWTQISISCGAFAVWVFALGGPFATLQFYDQMYGSLLLITYTALVPLIVPDEE